MLVRDNFGPSLVRLLLVLKILYHGAFGSQVCSEGISDQEANVWRARSTISPDVLGAVDRSCSRDPHSLETARRVNRTS